MASRANLSGQQITYQYTQKNLNVGPDGQGLSYTISNHLSEIKVTGGDSVTFIYKEKEAWEYPTLHTKLGTDEIVTNAFQDRIETKYLQEVILYDVNEIAQKKVSLKYDFLYEHFQSDNLPSETQGTLDIQSMNKRMLVEVRTLTNDNIEMLPSQKFDYWGLYDSELQNHIGKNKDKFKALSSSDLSLQNMKPGPNPNFYEGQTYNTILGHLKTIQSPEGGLVWYSYKDNSQEEGWELKLHSSDINPPIRVLPGLDQAVTFKNPTPYWGNDHYMVLSWEGIDSLENKWIFLQLYEWKGKWINVVCQNSNTNQKEDLLFRVYDFEEFYVRINTGVGKFALVCANLPINSLNGKGTIILFHRDQNIPGQWNSTYFTPSTYDKIGSSIPTHPVNDTRFPSYFEYMQLSLEIGDNIAALLDTFSGYLHLYSLANNQWSYKSEGSITITPTVRRRKSVHFVGANPDPSFHTFTSNSGMSVLGNDVFIISSRTNYATRGNLRDYPVECDVFYEMWHYDETSSKASNQAWIPVIPKTLWGKNVLENLNGSYNNPLGTYMVGIDISVGSGFLTAQLILEYNPLPPGTTFISRPVSVSWNEMYNAVNFQQIYSPNNAGAYASGNLFWGDVLKKSHVIIQDASGTLTTSNLINISTGKGSVKGKNKYIARYVGGDQVSDDGKNIGWVCNNNLCDLDDNSEPWEKMASLDTTVGIQTEGIIDYKCKFYQFNPYSEAPYSGPHWSYQSLVNMGVKADWKRVNQIVDDVVFFIETAIAIIALPASFGASGAFWEAMNFLDFIVNGPGDLAFGAIESSTFDQLLRNRRSGDTSLGIDYLLVGVGETPRRLYFKKWDTATSHWIWDTADQYKLFEKFLENYHKEVPYSQGWLPPTISFDDIYHYGSSFIPFSCRALEYKDGTLNGIRHVYLDQIAFLRNGILSKISSMPKFKTTSKKDAAHINPHYDPIKLPYCLSHNESAENFNLYAPWGGILGYKPQVYTDYHSSFSHISDIIIGVILRIVGKSVV